MGQLGNTLTLVQIQPLKDMLPRALLSDILYKSLEYLQAEFRFVVEAHLLVRCPYAEAGSGEAHGNEPLPIVPHSLHLFDTRQLNDPSQRVLPTRWRSYMLRIRSTPVGDALRICFPCIEQSKHNGSTVICKQGNSEEKGWRCCWWLVKISQQESKLGFEVWDNCFTMKDFSRYYSMDNP